MSNKKMYQILILKLSDGREIKAAVPEFCKEGELWSVISIRVTEPRELTEDMYWSIGLAETESSNG